MKPTERVKNRKQEVMRDLFSVALRRKKNLSPLNIISCFLFFYFWYKIQNIAGSSSGRTHASEACYLGSNPSPAAKNFYPSVPVFSGDYPFTLNISVFIFSV